jgi:hypothetical protein
MELIMTNASAAPVRGADLAAPAHQQNEAPRRASAEQMADLLRRYPNIAEAERLDLVDFLKRGHPDIVAMASYGAGLEPRVIAVKRDHPEHFSSGARALLPWLGLLLVVPLLLLLLGRAL